MKLIKTLTRSDRFRAALCWLGAQYIRFVYLTGRWDVINGEKAEKFWQEDKPFILAFWHGRILLMPYCWNQKKQIHMLISQHRDGQLIAKTVGHFGIKTIEGSTSKGGAQALRAMLKKLKGGEWIGITPDGPRGPRMRASSGIVSVAKMSGAPVLACAFGTKSRKMLGSWDRFCLALPFSKGVFVWSDPIYVPKKADANDLATYQQDIEDALTAAQNACDEMTGHAHVEAA